MFYGSECIFALGSVFSADLSVPALFLCHDEPNNDSLQTLMLYVCLCVCLSVSKPEVSKEGPEKTKYGDVIE